METPPPKPWTVAQFELYRPHMSNWIIHNLCPPLEDPDCPRIVVRAPVKSGKREIVEYMAKRDESHVSPRVHLFLSAWHRAADEVQRKELAEHNMKVFSINKNPEADKCVMWIRTQINLGKKIVIHLDECDHGSGDKQILGKVYNSIRDIPEVFTILYSATPQEVLFSGDINSVDEDDMLDDMLYGIHVEYTPPAGYCGPGRFLDENLVIDAKPFFTLNNKILALTDQGREIIEGLKVSTQSGSGRNIVTLRLTKKEGRNKDGKDIYKFLKHFNSCPELRGIHVWVDKSDCDIGDGSARKIEWSSKDYWVTTAKDVPILIVMDQTSSRSTEWACHDRIYATHDFRTSIQYAVVSQAQERVNHYNSKYNGFQPIRVYGHKKTFELSASRISYEQYLTCEWDMRKVDVRRKLGDDVYEIKNDAGILHPKYGSPMSKAKAEEALMELGCFGNMSISNRVAGKMRPLPIFNTYWFPTTEATWDADIEEVKNMVENGKYSARNFENPFQTASTRGFGPNPDGMFYGYLRGWKILQYETDIQTQPGWGVLLNAPRVTVCYNNGVLGAAFRWHTGKFKMTNRLTTYRSMYPSKYRRVISVESP